jgi:hypothetical protein
MDSEDSEVEAKVVKKRGRRGSGFHQLKPRSDCTLAYISDEAREQLIQWLLNSRFSLNVIQAKMKETFGVHAAPTSLSDFYAKYVHPAVLKRRERAMELATEMAAKVERERNPGKFYMAAIDELARRGMKLAIDENTTPKELTRMIDSMIRARKQTLDEQKLDLMERRLKVIERRQTALEKALNNRGSSKLSNNEFVEHMRKIFRGEEITHNGIESAVKATNGFRDGKPA